MKPTKQFNAELPKNLIKKVEIFTSTHDFKSIKEATEMLLEVGLEVCEEKLKKQKLHAKKDV